MEITDKEITIYIICYITYVCVAAFCPIEMENQKLSCVCIYVMRIMYLWLERK